MNFFDPPLMIQSARTIPDLYAVWLHATERRVTFSPYGGRIYAARVGDQTLVVEVNSVGHWYRTTLVYDPRNEWRPVLSATRLIDSPLNTAHSRP